LKSKFVERFGTCSKDCYGSCVFLGSWNDNAEEFKFLESVPQKSHPFTNGFFCEKMNTRKELLYHSKRLKHSLVRKGKKGSNEFQKVNNDKAINIIAKKVQQIIENFGPESILGAFNAGNYGLISMYSPIRFFKALGGTITSGGICNEGGCAGLKDLFGTYSITNPLQLINPETHLIVIWGSDLSDRNSHSYSLIKQARHNGTKLIVLDSRRTQIAKEADLFIYTVPGTDHLISQLICKYLIENQLHDRDFLIKYTQDYIPIIKKIRNLNEEEITKTLDLKLEQINTFFNLLTEYKNHTIFNIGYGVQKDFYGGKIIQNIALIQILLGNLGKPGTGIIYSQSDFLKPFLQPLMEYITGVSIENTLPQINLISLGKELQSNKFKMIFVYNFNPLSSLPNLNNIKNCFLKKDLFVVVQDLFLNATTKFADIVIPSKFDLECSDIISPYYIPSISINNGGPCPYPNCLSNFEFFQKLYNNLCIGENPEFNENDNQILEHCLNLLPPNFKDNIIRNGYHLLFDINSVPFSGLAFPTFNNKINLKNVKLDFGDEWLNSIRKRKKNSFILISPSHKYYIHSQLGQIHNHELDAFNKVFLCEEDITFLHLKEGDKVNVSNYLGQGDYFVARTSILTKGIALIYSGVPIESKINFNVNIFTPDNPEELGFSGSYNSTLVEINSLKH